MIVHDLFYLGLLAAAVILIFATFRLKNSHHLIERALDVESGKISIEDENPPDDYEEEDEEWDDEDDFYEDWEDDYDEEDEEEYEGDVGKSGKK